MRRVLWHERGSGRQGTAESEVLMEVWEVALTALIGVMVGGLGASLISRRREIEGAKWETEFYRKKEQEQQIETEYYKFLANRAVRVLNDAILIALDRRPGSDEIHKHTDACSIRYKALGRNNMRLDFVYNEKLQHRYGRFTGVDKGGIFLMPYWEYSYRTEDGEFIEVLGPVENYKSLYNLGLEFGRDAAKDKSYCDYNTEVEKLEDKQENSIITNIWREKDA